MSVDKFGRQSGSNNNKGLRGPKGEGFELTSTGDYDICLKRLRNVMEPEDDGDAVTLKRLKTSLNKCLKQNDNKAYDAKGSTVCNVGDPTSLTDAVNFKYIKDHCVTYDDKQIDVKNRIIRNLSDPVNAHDAVHKLYVDNSCPPTSESYWNFLNRRLVNVNDPINKNDAVNLKYLLNIVPTSNKSTWNFANKILTNVADPVNYDDCVTLNYLVKTLCNILYDLYKSLAPGGDPIRVLNKAEWIKRVIVDQHFIKPKGTIV